uniref:AlNc14C220G9082 protein n=1 Tax=Albugo laibachii Nc14 TaxID=890382 RepID=F0WRT7_9STRA|nr:AlNc14C220G9082 [Albugo laibachii Nc14]|eukprot:CCA24053.1 AlNc14C220G9082 [Albugo laibachii Nc14]
MPLTVWKRAMNLKYLKKMQTPTRKLGRHTSISIDTYNVIMDDAENDYFSYNLGRDSANSQTILNNVYILELSKERHRTRSVDATVIFTTSANRSNNHEGGVQITLSHMCREVSAN